jgi:hypothetical protein
MVKNDTIIITLICYAKSVTHTVARGQSLSFYFYLPFCVKSKLSLKSVINVTQGGRGGGDQNRAKKSVTYYLIGP